MHNDTCISLIMRIPTGYNLVAIQRHGSMVVKSRMINDQSIVMFVDPGAIDHWHEFAVPKNSSWNSDDKMSTFQSWFFNWISHLCVGYFVCIALHLYILDVSWNAILQMNNLPWNMPSRYKKKTMFGLSFYKNQIDLLLCSNSGTLVQLIFSSS